MADDDAQMFPSIPLADFPLHTVRQDEKQEDGQYDAFQLEFHVLQMVQQSTEQDLYRVYPETAFQRKNRYTDILPNRDHRVKLTMLNNNPASDYINASHIPSLLPGQQHTYIAATAPIPTSFEDWWRMIWEYDMNLIVMVTKLVEKNRIKAHQYWPANSDDLKEGEFLIRTTKSVQKESDTLIHSLELSRGEQKRQITLLYYPEWPDFNSPKDMTSVLDFCTTYRRFRPNPMQNEGKMAPVLVHCSAGVGRTGTFIAIDALLDYLHSERLANSNDIVTINIFNLVSALRAHRPGMVQSAKQYAFISKFICHCLKHKLLGL